MSGNYIKNIILCSIVLLLVNSCSSVHVSDKYNGQQISPEPVIPVAHINAQCCGIYFFNAVPIVVGSTDWPGMFMLFCDNVTSEKTTSMLMEQASNLKASRVIDLNSHYKVEPNPILFYLITSRTVVVSGNAVK